jgi:hypothetical protein
MGRTAGRAQTLSCSDTEHGWISWEKKKRRGRERRRQEGVGGARVDGISIQGFGEGKGGGWRAR